MLCIVSKLFVSFTTVLTPKMSQKIYPFAVFNLSICCFFTVVKQGADDNNV